jgi:PncC family amidohydrolase
MNQDIENTLKKVHDIFKSSQLSLSVAESCTGGLISHYITSLPGASIFFKAGIVPYSEKAKENILGVSNELLNNFGLVSEETAKEMAEQVRLIADSDYSIATTGNLGPDVLEGKDKGLIYIAVSKKGKTVTKQLNLNGNREENKEEAALSALNLLIDIVGSND